MRLNTIFQFAVAAVVAWFPLACTGSDRPNVILILADDLGMESVEDYGGVEYKTPRMSQLAREGLRFTHAYAQPLCTNTRVQLMTGIYNHRNWIAFGILDPQAVTFGHAMQAAGYETCIVGKWQLQSYDPPDFPGAEKRRSLGMQVNQAGFDEYCLWHTGHTEVKGSRYAAPVINQNGKMLEDTDGKYGPDIWTDYLCQYVTREHDKPFFVYYPMALPHNPFSPTPASKAWQDPERRFEDDPVYFGDMVQYTDRLLGRIVDAVDHAGIGKETLILFFSDNGTNQKVVVETKKGPVQGGKGLTIDDAVHVPFYARWTGKIAPGVNENLIDSTDFFPTILEAAGKTVPPQSKLDGISFFPQLLGQPGKTRDWVFFHYDPRPGWDKHKFQLSRFIQTKKYKLYANGQLFDLEHDRLEQEAIYTERDTRTTAQVRRKLQAVLKQKEAEWVKARN